jgi:adenosine deaminase
MTDLALGKEYLAVASAYGWGFDDLVAVAHDGVDATWLGDDGKRELHHLIDEAAQLLSPPVAG